LSQVLDRGAQIDFCSTARCALLVFHRGAQAEPHGAATLSQQVKNNSADLHQKKVIITGFICMVPR
jgi:hypothetical protein